MPKLIPNLWFDTQAAEAAEFYVALFPNSRVNATTHYPEGSGDRAGTVLTVDFELDGQPFTALNGGDQFHFDEAISFVIDCADQAEVDRYWEALTADGGEESQCGWCKDRFGLSWQVVPQGFVEIMNDPDPARGARAMQAMFQMKKLDLATLLAAADGA